MRNNKKRIKAESNKLTVKVYEVVRRAVEEGVERGYHRAFKYCESPGESEIKEAIYTAVMGEMCEWFLFGSEFGDAE